MRSKNECGALRATELMPNLYPYQRNIKTIFNGQKPLQEKICINSLIKFVQVLIRKYYFLIFPEINCIV